MNNLINQGDFKLMTVLKSVENIVETSNKKAANTITSSVIKYLNENHLAAQNKRQKNKQRNAVKQNYILTEDQVREVLAAVIAEKFKKRSQLEERKVARVEKRKGKMIQQSLAKKKGRKNLFLNKKVLKPKL